jgi:hypothetical protein
MIRLAYSAPEMAVVKQKPPAISIMEMVEMAKLSWGGAGGSDVWVQAAQKDP